MMDHDAQAICGPRHARGRFRRAHRWGKTKGKIGFHGGKVEIERGICHNVKRWRSASMAMRWTAAAMQEAAKGFRRLQLDRQLPVLRAALAASLKTKTHTAFLLAKPTPPNINLSSGRLAMFNKKWDISAHSSLRKISTACTTSVTPVLTATRSATPAAGIAGAAASGAQDGIIGGGDGAAGRSAFGPSFSATSFPSPSVPITIPSGLWSGFHSRQHLRPRGLISGPTTGTRPITRDIWILPTSVTAAARRRRAARLRQARWVASRRSGLP